MSPASPSCPSPGFAPVQQGPCPASSRTSWSPKSPEGDPLRTDRSSARRGHPGLASRCPHPPATWGQREQGRAHLCASTDAVDLQGPGLQVGGGLGDTERCSGPKASARLLELEAELCSAPLFHVNLMTTFHRRGHRWGRGVGVRRQRQEEPLGPCSQEGPQLV